ncbi:uncharacterized protein LOC106463367 [Limulus polyphemus]|uniref:Uncharacterized protein LOC106463367 n=1 Tax=Limulus polyphemus TaxID=6850 RepID=A0ABM1SSE7_LIMPO|nr:uncharacterized protein LOC106463367 [Limulus polyphemus]
MFVLLQYINKMKGLFLLMCLHLVKGLSLDEIHAYQNSPERRGNLLDAVDYDQYAVPYPFSLVHQSVPDTDRTKEYTTFRDLKKKQAYVVSEDVAPSDGLFAAGISNKLLRTLHELDRQMAQKEAVSRHQDPYNQLIRHQRFPISDEDAKSFIDRNDYDQENAYKRSVYSLGLRSPPTESSFWTKQRFNFAPAFSDTYMGNRKWADVDEPGREFNERQKTRAWKENGENEIFKGEDTEYADFFPLSTSERSQPKLQENRKFPSLKQTVIEPGEMREFLQAMSMTKRKSLNDPLSRTMLLMNKEKDDSEDVFKYLTSESQRRNMRNEPFTNRFENSVGEGKDANIDEETISNLGLEELPPLFGKTKHITLNKRDYKFATNGKSATMSELRNIFEDDGDKRAFKKRRIEYQGEKPSRTKSGKNETDELPVHSEESIKNDFSKITTEISTTEQKKSKDPDIKEDFEKWLRKEYIKNMAKALNTLRKKRSNNWTSVLSKDIEDFLQHAGNEEKSVSKIDKKQVKKNVNKNENVADGKATKQESIIIKDGNEKKGSLSSQKLQFEQAAHKIKEIENSMLSAAMKIMKKGATEGFHLDAEKISHRLEAARELDNLRQALAHLHMALDKIEQEGQENVKVSSEGEDESTERTTPDRSSFMEKITEPEGGDHHEESKVFHIQPAVDMNSKVLKNLDRYNTGQPNQKEDSCPPLKLLTSDCATIDYYLPDETFRQMFSCLTFL